MDYEADVEQFQVDLEDIRKDHELFDTALSGGWKPDFPKAIETWHTACLELEIGEGYVEHILEEHPESDIIWRMESVLVSQAEEFLVELGEEVPDETSKCPMDIIEERQVTIDNPIRITNETPAIAGNELGKSTLYYVAELDQATWCIGSAEVGVDEIKDAKVPGGYIAAARRGARRVAAIFDMVQSGMMCKCGKHRIEYKSIPWEDSFLTGYAEIE